VQYRRVPEFVHGSFAPEFSQWRICNEPLLEKKVTKGELLLESSEFQIYGIELCHFVSRRLLSEYLKLPLCQQTLLTSS